MVGLRSRRPPPVATLLRAAVALPLGWAVVVALQAPELPVAARVLALAIAAATLWRGGHGLILLAALAPAGALLAPAPIRTVELFAWSFLAAWLLALWRPLAPAGWPRGVTSAAVLLGATLVTSWVALTLGDAAGVGPWRLLPLLWQSLPPDYLLRSTPEPETWSMLQAATGLAVFLGSLALTRHDPRVVFSLGAALVGSAAVLSAATIADIARQWSEAGYGAWFLLRYVSGERESLHFSDMNAAGSVYVLAGLTSLVLAGIDAQRRLLWGALLAVILPGVWLAGSLSAVGSAVIVMLALAVARRGGGWRRSTKHLAAAAVGVALAAGTVGLLAALRDGERATTTQALLMRSQFVETSARMFASAPAFGVGVGRYFDESAAFMPPELRAMYGNENAHNYYAQVFAELGLVGGLLFAWLAVAGVRRGWAASRAEPGDAVRLGLLAGTAAYLLTCLTGHPLLVPAAAVPFWAAFGAVTSPPAADVRAAGVVRNHWAIAAAIVGVLLAVQAGVAAGSALLAATPPREEGFHTFETHPDGTRFRWMTRHAVAYIPGEPGFLTLTLRAPDEVQLPAPVTVEVAIAGRLMRTEMLQPGRWTTVQIGLRDEAWAEFRRVDLRASEEWSQQVRLGSRVAERPISVMVGEIGWTDLDALP